LEAQFHSDRARPGRSEQSVLSFIASCSFFLIGELLLGKLSETVVVVGNAPHDRPCSLVSHLIGNRASFLCTKAPMVRVPETNFLQGITSISGRHVSGDPRPLSTSRTVYRPDQHGSYRVPPSRVHFWTTPAATFGGLLICAKYLLVEAMDAKRPRPFAGRGKLSRAGSEAIRPF